MATSRLLAAHPRAANTLSARNTSSALPHGQELLFPPAVTPVVFSVVAPVFNEEVTLPLQGRSLERPAL
jgi:hypothetical protein